MPKIYSPSQTETYMYCPMKRALAQGWEPRRIYGPRDFGAVLGDAVSAGMASYHEQRAARPPQPLNEIVDNAVAATRARVLARLQDFADRGRVVTERDEAQQKAVLPRAERCVQRMIEQHPLPDDWRVVAIEKELPDYGYLRPDLVVDNGRGEAPLDYKVKLTLKDEWRQREIERYARSWQLLQYAWAWARHTERPVDHYYVVLTVLEPRFSTELLAFEVKPEKLAQFEAFALVVWRDMEAEDDNRRLVRGQTKCEDGFGPCDFVKACWDHHYDPTLMAQDYVPRGARF